MAASMSPLTHDRLSLVRVTDPWAVLWARLWLRYVTELRNFDKVMT